MSTTSIPALTKSFVVKLEARAETADEVAVFLTDAVSLANAEAGTIVWFGLRTDATTFWVVDAFHSDVERQNHLDGPIAAALMANAARLFATAPEILPADILSAKVG